MKLKKIAVVGMCLLCALMLSSCGNKSLPKGMDEKQVIAAGEQVFALLQEDRFDEIAAMIREDIRTELAITGEKVKEQMDVDTSKSGQFKEVEETWTSGVNDEEDPHGIAWLECEFKEETLVFGFAFDTEMNLIGMSINRR